MPFDCLCACSHKMICCLIKCVHWACEKVLVCGMITCTCTNLFVLKIHFIGLPSSIIQYKTKLMCSACDDKRCCIYNNTIFMSLGEHKSVMNATIVISHIFKHQCSGISTEAGKAPVLEQERKNIIQKRFSPHLSPQTYDS